MAETSEISLATPKAGQYVLQLTKHFGHKITVEEKEDRTLFHFTAGLGTARAEGEHLVLGAEAETLENRQKVETILGSHLERFAFREDLRAIWPDQQHTDPQS